MTLFRRRLEVTELDARILPSGSAAPVTAPVSHAAVVAGQTAAHALAGTGHGSSFAAPTRYGTGATYLLFGSANLAGLGPVTLTGTIQMPFFRTVGAVTGTLTLVGSRGKVTVQLQAPAQSGALPPPKQFSYKIVGATRGYQGLQDSGTLQIVLGRTFTYSA
jgi:hypothetical protein